MVMGRTSYHETIHYLKKHAEHKASESDSFSASISPKIKKFIQHRKEKRAQFLESIKKLFLGSFAT